MDDGLLRAGVIPRDEARGRKLAKQEPLASGIRRKDTHPLFVGGRDTGASRKTYSLAKNHDAVFEVVGDA